MSPQYDPAVVVLSVLISALASFVALALASRVYAPDRFLATVWTVGGALVMGSGIWAMHFVGMLAMTLPVQVGYDALLTFLSWAAAVAVSALALRIAARQRLGPAMLAGGAVVMGAGICAMHYTGMAAMMMSPGIVWNAWLVLASVVIACGAATAALLIFFGMRRVDGVRKVIAQCAAALVMGGAISGMHYTAMAAAGFPATSFCLSVDGLGGRSLGAMVGFAALLMLAITLFMTLLDARLQAKAQGLAQSLQVANEELRQLAFRDPLTGVPNRMLFEQRLMQAVLELDARRPAAGSQPAAAARLALLFIDLDGFKAVNDSYGHACGDAVLCQVAQRLTRLVGPHQMLARIGGDEFVLLVEQVGAADEVLPQADRILGAMLTPFDLSGRRATLSCSIGVAIYPDHGPRDKLLACADAAMYGAKRGGGDMVAMFDPHLHQGMSDQLDMQEALRDAIDQGRLELHYQPKVDAGSGQIHGVEALLRWTDPVRGAISPAVFIPLAERCGLIVPIGNWVIDEAMRQLSRWRVEGLTLCVSINLSAYQLRHLDIVERLRNAMRRHHIEPAQVVCEITESVAMEDTQGAHHVIEQLAALGVSLSIDDFGTGYSSLASLRQMKIQELKIDRSFVKDVASSPDARAVVDAVVQLARALGLRVVAEGVETQLQRDVLIELGCHELQGFFFARPMPALAVLDKLGKTSDLAAVAAEVTAAASAVVSAP